MVAIVLAVALANVATSVLYWLACRRLVSDTAAATAAACSNHVAQVAADVSRLRDATRDLADVVTSMGAGLASASSDTYDGPPVVLGGGRIRTVNGGTMLYIDYRFPDGSTERRYSRPFQVPAMPSMASNSVQ